MFSTLINTGRMKIWRKKETNSKYSYLQSLMINWATNFVIRLLVKGLKMNKTRTINNYKTREDSDLIIKLILR